MKNIITKAVDPLNSSDREYVGWEEGVVYEWEESIFYLPMWHQSMWMPIEMWEFWGDMMELSPELVEHRLQQAERYADNS